MILMVGVGIVGIGSYVPPKIMTNKDWENIVDTSNKWIVEKTGIIERRISEPDVCTSDLAVFAAIKAMKMAKIKPEDIDMIILATSSPDVPLSSTAGITQNKLGCINASAFDINAVCAGWIHALEIGTKFTADNNYENILVIGAETYSRIVNWKDRSTCVLFGDGAGAAVLQKVEEGKGMLGTWIKSDGSGANVIEIPAGGVRKSLSSDSFVEGEQYFQMNGRAVWDFAIDAMPEAVINVLKRVNRDLSEVDMIIPHQANLNIIKEGMKKLNLPMEKTFINLQKYGNTAGASVPIALSEAVSEGKIKSGDLVVTVAFGGGLAWGANAMIWQ
ncbi:MAG: ketoacyl-ACP synthase III [Euryarchaeota archaeon]|jgi:3-oxoacyl-[acyl-carrier-protein] synthase-3|nr:ketoacyl-ACP synthase III [Euryarchaeota archaeon]MBT4803012.1 ketoacyl-ACP synthase III [Euryarchaeota archaeon]MBT6683444.1 ketoacyl-ACP synthase III [Euryarchaeota archaeon]MBT6874823.1 ketoacyl-ACP synthase III [Euryarchaeota archaeon]MBT7413138.1 ketoacyl-ACP synthase III [Euryarchaeota archaeon]|tara:strand:- start:1585 stop:2577 length:993 start_codon:yes stop_codon:yes gene_type:complete